MFSAEPLKRSERWWPSGSGLTREYQVCSSRSAIWPSQRRVGRLLQIRYSWSPSLCSENRRTLATNGVRQDVGRNPRQVGDQVALGEGRAFAQRGPEPLIEVVEGEFVSLNREGELL